MRPWLDKAEVLRDGLSTRVTFLEIQLERIRIVKTSDREES